MGNSQVIRNPSEDPPYGIRHCLLCRHCDRGPRVWNSGQGMSVLCSLQRVFDEPETGCARFDFDPQALGG